MQPQSSHTQMSWVINQVLTSPTPCCRALPAFPTLLLPRQQLGNGKGAGFCVATSYGSYCNKPRCVQRASTDSADVAGSPVHAMAPPPASLPGCAMHPLPQPLPSPASAPRSPRNLRSWLLRHLPSLPVCTTPLLRDQVGARPPVPTQLSMWRGRRGSQSNPTRARKHHWIWENPRIEICFTNKHSAEVTAHLLV